jgi:hypothetical protein
VSKKNLNPYLRANLMIEVGVEEAKTNQPGLFHLQTTQPPENELLFK